MRILCVKPLDIRKKYQQIGFGLCGNNRRKRIVVADRYLIGGYRVVFVYNRQCAHFKKAFNRVFEIAAAFRIFKVASGQQYLPYGVTVFRKILVICIHQLALTDRRRRLFCRHIFRLFPQRQPAHSHAYSAGRHHDHVMPCVFQIADHTAKSFNMSYIHISVAVCKRRRSDLNYDPHYNSPFNKIIFQYITTFFVLQGNRSLKYTVF